MAAGVVVLLLLLLLLLPLPPPPPPAAAARSCGPRCRWQSMQPQCGTHAGTSPGWRAAGR
jgi:hypothetical protein